MQENNIDKVIKELDKVREQLQKNVCENIDLIKKHSKIGKWDVIFTGDFEKNFYLYLENIKNLQKFDNYKSAEFTSKLFQCFTGKWNILLNDGRHIVGLQLWLTISELVNKWENVNQRIHKGALYYWISISYLIIGDIDTAFTFLFNALEEDRKLNINVDKSPSYLTLTLSGNENNFMQPYVFSIRNKLQKIIDSYNIEFNKDLEIDEIINLFQKDKSNDTIFFFLYSIYGQFSNIKIKLVIIT